MANLRQDWSLSQWLDYLENRDSPQIQLRLENVCKVANLLGLDQWSIPIILVGGTNGKGSTVAALSAIYKASGYRVGQFTSPHLLHFNERIAINNQAISDQALCAAFQFIEAHCQGTHLSYFEMSFLAALLYFKTADLNLLIIEVGIGGRLDATNCLNADLAIITTVDLDHQDYLGPDLESIGFEKAGILRPNQYFIYADHHPPQSVLKQAKQCHSQMDCLGISYTFEQKDQRLYLSIAGHPDPIVLPCPTIHLHAAAAAIIASYRLQSKLSLSADAWTKGMQEVEIKGRRQWIQGQSCALLVDVAHNPQSARLLAQTVTQAKPKGQVYAVFSALQNKDIDGIVEPFSSIINQWYLSSLCGKRATARDRLEEVMANQQLSERFSFYTEPGQAYLAAVNQAMPEDLILVFGSFLLVEAVIKAAGVRL